MNFTLSEEQHDLQAAVRSFLEDRGIGYARRMWDDEQGFDGAVWAQMVELGWTGLVVPEAQGGFGLGMVDAAVVLEEMGRFAFPGPFLSSAMFATIAARHLGLTDRLESLAAGTTRGTIAVEEKGAGDPVDRIRTRAIRKSGQWRLTGLKPVVFDGNSADWCLVAARTEHGLGTFVIEAPEAPAVPSWDQTRKVTRLDLSGRAGEPVGPDGDHTTIWRRIVDDANVALCAEMLGAMQGAYDAAVEYAKHRVQFGRPIAKFQVIRHKAVDMLHRVELARVGVHYAAWASDVDDGVRAEAVAMAKGYTAEAGNFVCAESIQIHGGVGFTWDCDAHLFYRRCKQNDLTLGYQGWHRERLADLVLASA
ncbi:MAG: acyl-CoA/acyl-ACP dehydrogenase [Actinobacteria bacterium]|nr:acyl-CoA/acyl-ACP dehydrogenase [Actinomycetota bacterium]